MHWIVLIISGVFEAVWATALSQSNGFSRLGPSVVFLIGIVASMSGLAFALKHIPVGTGYAIWVGVGACTTILYAMFSGQEGVSMIKLLCLAAIVAGIVGLKLATH
ncbi:DMT family transporter [Collinsella vaginalis]|uniref:DMT family transporter n=1 Tax=Collinsella vaginalis TaxID=1870987 RepID=UPI000A269D05|nr:multidrug efflux SMR transporter [Collinsella vaginalis]